MKDAGLRYTLYFILFWVILFVLCCCKTIKEVPVEKVVTKTEYRDRLQYDSIYTRDSIYLQAKGDTIYLSKYKYIYRDKLVRDTAYVHRIDSIQVPYRVEKELNKWQSFKLELGGWAFGAILILCIVVVWLARAKRKS